MLFDEERKKLWKKICVNINKYKKSIHIDDDIQIPEEVRSKFLEEVRVNLDEYRKSIHEDVNTQIALDVKHMRNDWKNIGNDMKLAIEKQIENEK